MFLLNRFYREIALNGKRVKAISNKAELEQFINKYNGVANLYTTVNSYKQANGLCFYNSIILDKVFIDIDPKEGIDIVIEAKKVLKYIEEQRLAHSISFSGRGIHIFIYCKVEELLNPEIALRSFGYELKNKTGAEIDMTVFDIAREVRLLNTINMRTGLYCIPIKKEELNDMNFIRETAKTIRALSPDYLYEGNMLSLKPYDNNIPIDTHTQMASFDDLGNLFSTKSVINPDIFIKSVEDIPCLKEIVEDDKAGWHSRSWLLSYMKNKGYSMNDAEAVIKAFISKEKWNKSNCTRSHARNFYSRNYMLLSCEQVAAMGLCPLAKKQSDCKHYNKLVS